MRRLAYSATGAFLKNESIHFHLQYGRKNFKKFQIIQM